MQRKSQQVVVRLTEAERQRLDDLAEHAKLTPSEVVRRILGAADRIEPVTIIFANNGGAVSTKTARAAVA